MRRRIALALGATALLLAVAYMAVGYLIYDQLSRVKAGGGESAGNTPSKFVVTSEKWATFNVAPYLMPTYVTVRIPSRQTGVHLAAWYVPGDPNAPAVVLTHGLGGCKCQANILLVAGMLHRNGFTVLLYDLREHGESDIVDGRAAVGNDEYLDALGAWDWLISEKDFTTNRIGLYGQSFGAGTTLIAFSEEPQAAAAFVDSPYADLRQIMDEELVRNSYPTFLDAGGFAAARVVSGVDLLEHSPRDAIVRDAGRPLYLVHGTADSRVSPHHTRDLADLADALGADVTVWMPEGVDHVESEYMYPVDYEQRLVEFFSQVLGP